MRTMQVNRVVRLVAWSALALGVVPALAQDAPKPSQAATDGPAKAAPSRAPAPGGYLTTVSIFAQGKPKPPAPASDAGSKDHEPLPAPRPADGSTPDSHPDTAKESKASGPAPDSARPVSWWKRYKIGLWPCLGFESEFEPAPFGASVYATYRSHVANGEAARMVLHHYDFVGDTATLNTKGQDQVAKIAAMLAHNAFPVIVERTPCNPAIAEARRLAVLKQFGQGGIPIPPERVVIGPSIGNGLRGGEAEIIYQNLLSQTRERGQVTGAASGLLGPTPSQPGAGAGTGGGTGAPPSPR
ncbi:MAG TPA: hypothetical protein VKE94_02560 [Gemmataceae bacterium]|nr:hypothetical protein [Gemmataceae bacterium]